MDMPEDIDLELLGWDSHDWLVCATNVCACLCLCTRRSGGIESRLFDVT